MSENEQTPAGLAAATGVQSKDALINQLDRILPNSPCTVKAMSEALDFFANSADRAFTLNLIHGETWAGCEQLIQLGQMAVALAQAPRPGA